MSVLLIPLVEGKSVGGDDDWDARNASTLCVRVVIRVSVLSTRPGCLSEWGRGRAKVRIAVDARVCEGDELTCASSTFLIPTSSTARLDDDAAGTALTAELGRDDGGSRAESRAVRSELAAGNRGSPISKSN